MPTVMPFNVIVPKFYERFSADWLYNTIIGNPQFREYLSTVIAKASAIDLGDNPTQYAKIPEYIKEYLEAALNGTLNENNKDAFEKQYTLKLLEKTGLFIANTDVVE